MLKNKGKEITLVEAEASLETAKKDATDFFEKENNRLPCPSVEKEIEVLIAAASKGHALLEEVLACEISLADLKNKAAKKDAIDHSYLHKVASLKKAAIMNEKAFCHKCYSKAKKLLKLSVAGATNEEERRKFRLLAAQVGAEYGEQKLSFNREIAEASAEVKYSKVTYRQDLVDRGVLLSLSHVKQFFSLGPGVKTKAVHDVSFDIYKGESFGLVGESGCGKTTTGRSIIGLYDLTSGSIYYKGYRIAGGTRWNEKEIKWSRIHSKQKIARLKAMIEDEKGLTVVGEDGYVDNLKASNIDALEKKIEAEKEYEKNHIAEQKKIIKQIHYDNNHKNKALSHEIQMIFQDPVDSLDPRMTVEDIIEEGLHIQHSYDKAENMKKCADMLEKVGLIADYASRYPHEFSGGQRQRIGIARALVMNPKLLICDEPISALDVSIRAQILNLLNDIKEEMGLTLLFIAHDLSVVKYFCDRIAVMYFGNLVELASSEELFKHPLHPYTKSLLSAIPKPDPLGEKGRIRVVYDPSKAHDPKLGKPTLQEVVPGHFVLANETELQAYKAEITVIDQKAASKE